MSDEPSAHLALRAETGELERLRLWVEALCRLHQLPDRLALQLDLCLTELVTNVINYGYPEGAPAEAIVLHFEREPTDIVVAILDRGVEFDPLAYQPAPMAHTLEEAQIGGRGLLLVRQFAGRMEYRREADCNRLVLRFPAPRRTL